VSPYTVQLSNFRGNASAAVGSSQGLGPYGTYDLGGNVREWTANAVEGDLHFILCGSWRSPVYLYSSPEALSPSIVPTPTASVACATLAPCPPPLPSGFIASPAISRNTSLSSDEVFRAYELLYAYPSTPLNAKSEGIVRETPNWTEEKISFDAAYNCERMAAYLFLPRRVKRKRTPSPRRFESAANPSSAAAI